MEEILAVDRDEARERLVLPLVADDQVDVADGQRRQRLLRLGLDQLAAEVRCVARERLHRGDGKVERGRLEGGDARPAGDTPRHRGELRLGTFRPLEQRVGVTDEDERRVGQADTAAGALEERDARLALEHRELLRDGGGGEAKRFGHGGDRPARLELAKQPEAVEVQHAVENLPIEH